jgi:4-methyl-5(b-hydroxyethyl)-thiazole monophosphate biosynthesis
MKKTALIALAQGFEEVEAVVPVDILRRCDVDVIIAGLGASQISSARGMKITADVILEEYTATPDAVILPGGMPGAENLANSTKLKDLISKVNSGKKIVAAICASPALVLAPSGILKGRTATCYPGMEKIFACGVKFVKEEVVRDGNIITGSGPASAFAFGIKIAEELAGKEKARMIAGQMLYKL